MWYGGSYGEGKGKGDLAEVPEVTAKVKQMGFTVRPLHCLPSTRTVPRGLTSQGVWNRLSSSRNLMWENL
jgi:hypothetical protein